MNKLNRKILFRNLKVSETQSASTRESRGRESGVQPSLAIFEKKKDSIRYSYSIPSIILTRVAGISVLVCLLDFLFHFSKFLLESAFGVRHFTHLCLCISTEKQQKENSLNPFIRQKNDKMRENKAN